MRVVAGARLNEPDDEIVLEQEPGPRAERAERRGGRLLRILVPIRQENEDAARYHRGEGSQPKNLPNGVFHFGLLEQDTLAPRRKPAEAKLSRERQRLRPRTLSVSAVLFVMPKYLSVFHDKRDLLERRDILQRVSGHGDDIGQHSGGEVADGCRLAEQFSGD